MICLLWHASFSGETLRAGKSFPTWHILFNNKNILLNILIPVILIVKMINNNLACVVTGAPQVWGYAGTDPPPIGFTITLILNEIRWVMGMQLGAMEQRTDPICLRLKLTNLSYLEGVLIS